MNKKHTLRYTEGQNGRNESNYTSTVTLRNDPQNWSNTVDTYGTRFAECSEEKVNIIRFSLATRWTRLVTQFSLILHSGKEVFRRW